MHNELSVVLSVPAELNPEGLTIRVAGTPDAPLFCLADLCAVLGIGNPSDVARRLPDDEKNTLDIVEGVLGGPPRTFVTEGGLYRTVLTSRTDRAEPFRRWVCHEVLPSIRRHGCYPPPAGPQDPTLELLRQSALQLRIVTTMYATQQEHGHRLAAVECGLDRVGQVAQAALDTFSSNHGYYSVLGYARLRGWEMPVERAARHGKKLTGICRNLGVEVHRVRDTRYGRVNVYPESVLEQYFGEVEKN